MDIYLHYVADSEQGIDSREVKNSPFLAVLKNEVHKSSTNSLAKFWGEAELVGTYLHYEADSG